MSTKVRYRGQIEFSIDASSGADPRALVELIVDRVEGFLFHYHVGIEITDLEQDDIEEDED